ncbi:cutinase family protein [Mycobacterium colombiense]|uniref:cutinase family protein n=1 Tax=Mycobacterium colombiense TaxID=339268 RepID=UPI00096E35B7|nr:cutinase family protein [Mycobacterium colombiense]OMB93304.1 cutinase [Mycobacterium colombiense]OMC23960.1 cutinase [Mycobacterium colombiense]OMC28448.1 cutinase [Mycobacterium colombiense]
MNIRKVLAVVSARGLSVSALSAAAVFGPFVPSAPVPPAAAEPCPDVEVVFARGSGEPPGVGGIGQTFIDTLRSQVGGRSLTVYPVNYPASTDFSSADFPLTVIDGIRDASSHIESMAANCPNTKEVLGGYSQGAAVAGYTTSAAVPPGVPASLVPPPMPPDVAQHVAAVTLFGTPSGQFLQKYNAPPLTIGPLYQPKTLELCAQGDPVCGNAEGNDFAAHTSYPVNGMTNQAANFASSHL